MVPFQFTSNIYGQWHYGEVWCKLMVYFQTGALTLTTYTLAAIGLQWYNCPLVKPSETKRPLTRSKAIWAMVTIWTLASLAALPQLESYTTISVNTVVDDEPLIDIETLDQLKESTTTAANSTSVSTAGILSNLTELSHLMKEPTWRSYDACVMYQDNLAAQRARGDYTMSMFIIQQLVPTIICLFVSSKIGFRLYQTRNQAHQDPQVQQQQLGSGEIPDSDRQVGR